jgi:hypothetical protein
VVQDWYSLLLVKVKNTPQLRQEEIIDVFFDFYYSLSYDIKPKVALKQAFENLVQRRTKTSKASSQRTQAVDACVPGKKTLLKAQDSQPRRSAAEASHIDPKSSRGRSFNAVVKDEESVNDNNLLRKSSPTKRRANECLARIEKKQRIDASFDGSGVQTGKTLRKTKQRVTTNDELSDNPHELHGRPTRIRLHPRSQPVGMPEQKVVTRQMKQECIEDILSTQDTNQMDIKALPGKVVSGKTKRTRDDSDDLDDNFDKQFAKRKAKTDNCGRTILSASSEPTRKKGRKKRRKAKAKHVKLEEGPVTLDLQNANPILRKATNPQEVISSMAGDRNTPVPEVAVQQEDKALPRSSTLKDTDICNHRLRNKHSISPKNSTESPSASHISLEKSPPAKPSSTINDQRDPQDAVVPSGSPQPDSNPTSAFTTPATVRRSVTTTIHPQEETNLLENLTPEFSISVLNVAVEAEPIESSPHSNTVLFSKSLDATVKEMPDMVFGTTFTAQDVDSDERTETISQISSPPTSSLQTPPDSNISFPETRQLDISVADATSPYAISNDVPFAEPEEMKAMTLVSETLTILPVAHVSAPESTESSQPLEMKPPLPVLPPIWAKVCSFSCQYFHVDLFLAV